MHSVRDEMGGFGEDRGNAAASLHKRLLGLPKPQQHALIASLTPKGRAQLMAYIRSQEMELAELRRVAESSSPEGPSERFTPSPRKSCSTPSLPSSPEGTGARSFHHDGQLEDAQSHLLLLRKQKEFLESQLLQARRRKCELEEQHPHRSIPSRPAPRLGIGCESEDEEDAREDILRQWEQEGSHTRPGIPAPLNRSGLERTPRTDAAQLPSPTLSAMMRMLDSASPEERRRLIASLPQDRFLELISHLGDDEDDGDTDEASNDDLDSENDDYANKSRSQSEDEDLVKMAKNILDIGFEDEEASDGSSLTDDEEEPEVATATAPALPESSSSAICVSETSASGERRVPRNTKPLGQLQREGGAEASNITSLLHQLPPRSRDRSATLTLRTAWNKAHLGAPEEPAGWRGAAELKDSGIDGEPIRAWLGGEISTSLCCAKVLEAVARGHFCLAPAQRDVSRLVELYGQDCAVGGCLGALAGGLATLSELPGQQQAKSGGLLLAAASSPGQALGFAAQVLVTGEAGLDSEAVNFEFRRQCLQAHPQRQHGGLVHYLQVHCHLEVLRQAARIVERGSSCSIHGSRSGALVADRAADMAKMELARSDSEAAAEVAKLSEDELEAWNEQFSRYLLDLSSQKDAIKGMLEHLHSHEAYEVLSVDPSCSDAELARAYKVMAMRLHPDKGGDAEQFKAVRAAYDRILAARRGQEKKTETEKDCSAQGQDKAASSKKAAAKQEEAAVDEEESSKQTADATDGEATEKADPEEDDLLSDDRPKESKSVASSGKEATRPPADEQVSEQQEADEGSKNNGERNEEHEQEGEKWDDEKGKKEQDEEEDDDDDVKGDVQPPDDEHPAMQSGEGAESLPSRGSRPPTEAEAAPPAPKGPVDMQAVIDAIPVESVSRQAEHALDGAEMCMKVARLAEEAADAPYNAWPQLLQCGTHLLDSGHCVTEACQSVSKCAMSVPYDVMPLLERIRITQGMTRSVVKSTKDLMRCTDVISERGLKAAELSNRLLLQSREMADMLRTLSSAESMTGRSDTFSAPTRPAHAKVLARTLKSLAALARDTADASAASAVVVGDAQRHAQALKSMLDKLKQDEAESEEKKGENGDDEEDKETADSSGDEAEETPKDRAEANRRLLQKLNGEVLELQREMRGLVDRNPSLLPEVGVAQKDRMFGLVREIVQQMIWKVSMIDLVDGGPQCWKDAMEEALGLVKAAADWENLASPPFEARLLRAASLIDSRLLSELLQEFLLKCMSSCGVDDSIASCMEARLQESITGLCRNAQH
eukprot:TRINITY_DN1555_c6_g1_i1.p1 TRINITY_DN1555_c6_g1~~TRINITY_DN1555_c6_g1_i1.p1  ORF type:complete len:1284 (+),score=324.68 TRINITY_DN1555_c6_g1_i1:56-3907(+)